MANQEEKIAQLDAILAGLDKADVGVKEAIEAVDLYPLESEDVLARHLTRQASADDAYINNAAHYIQKARAAVEEEKSKLQSER